MPNFDFNVIAPPTVKKGETARIVLSQIPAAGDTVSISLVDPTGRTISANPRTLPSVGAIASVHCADFTPSYAGTHVVVAQIITTAPATTIGVGLFHVPAWLDNIDKPISDIAKSNTEISRLRTQYDRAKSGGI